MHIADLHGSCCAPASSAPACRSRSAAGAVVAAQRRRQGHDLQLRRRGHEHRPSTSRSTWRRSGRFRSSSSARTTSTASTPATPTRPRTPRSSTAAAYAMKGIKVDGRTPSPRTLPPKRPSTTPAAATGRCCWNASRSARLGHVLSDKNEYMDQEHAGGADRQRPGASPGRGCLRGWRRRGCPRRRSTSRCAARSTPRTRRSPIRTPIRPRSSRTTTARRRSR